MGEEKAVNSDSEQWRVAVPCLKEKRVLVWFSDYICAGWGVG